MTKRLRKMAIGAALLWLLVGCGKKNLYLVEHAATQTVPDRVDSEWFVREVFDEKGARALELVYCPIVPDRPTVCRTGVVWERDHSELFQQPAGPTAPPPSTAESAPPEPAEPTPADPSASGGCSRDEECKGGRVCRDGACDAPAE